jgi:heat shock protein HspQ
VLKKRVTEITGFMPAGTKTGMGQVVKHDLTHYGLGRLVIETEELYPDLETWLSVMAQNKRTVLLYHYSERVVGRSFSGFLWLFYKDVP